MRIGVKLPISLLSTGTLKYLTLFSSYVYVLRVKSVIINRRLLLRKASFIHGGMYGKKLRIKKCQYCLQNFLNCDFYLSDGDQSGRTIMTF